MTDASFSLLLVFFYFDCIHSHAFELFMLFCWFAFTEEIAICRGRVRTMMTMTMTVQPKTQSLHSSASQQTLTGAQKQSQVPKSSRKFPTQDLVLAKLPFQYFLTSLFCSISASARILLTSSPATAAHMAIMLMWPMTVRQPNSKSTTWQYQDKNVHSSSSQLFHICYPVAYPDGQEEMLKWSFICPNQTIFDQVSFLLKVLVGRVWEHVMRRQFSN